MNNNVESYIHKGIPVEIIVKVKPEPYQRQDLRVFENKISLLDQYDRSVDEFITNGAILDTVDAFRINFNSIFKKYISAIIQGINLNIFTCGSKSSGKSFSLEGNANESGIYSLLMENIFMILENKRQAILEEIKSLNIQEVSATTFTYSVRMKFVEIKDEAIVDLLQKYNYYKQPTQLIYSEAEGYTVSGAAWVALPNSMAFPDMFADAIRYRTAYDYNKVNKSATMLVLEINQLLENRATRDVKYISSKINVFDLPSIDILAEHFRNLSNSVEYKSIYAFQNMVGELAKSHNNALPTIYENSILTKLMKENIGGNGLCMGIFAVQNNNYAMSAITFKLMKLLSHVQNYPVVNDSNCHGLLRKFRVDISFYSKYKDLHPHDIKPPIVPPQRLNNAVNKQEPVGQAMVPQQENYNNNPNNNNYNRMNDVNVNEYTEKIRLLEKENMRLRSELQAAEDEKLKLLRNTTNARARHDHVRDFVDVGVADKYDVTDKMLHIEQDINEANEIMDTVNQLHEKIKSLQDERKFLEEENSTLRVTNQNLKAQLDLSEADTNQYRTNMDNELYNFKEMLNSTKNELDYMRNEAEKYRKIQADLIIEIDEREVQFKKQLEDKEREIEMRMLDLSQNEKRRLENEVREITRKLEHFGEENNDYNKIVDELKKENNRLTLVINEMRNTLREILGKGVEDKKETKVDSTGLQMSNKQKLIKTYNDRENEVLEQLGVEKAKAENLKEKLKKMRTYGRKVRNIALDYFPINEQLPEILTQDINVFLEDAENESVIQFLEFEIRTLRERNKKLEFEMTRLKDDFKVNPYEEYKKQQGTTKAIPRINQNKSNNNNNDGMNPFVNNANNNLSSINSYNSYEVNQIPKQWTEQDIQKRLLEEINKLQNTRPPRTPINSKEIDILKKENFNLQEEVKRLKVLINENLLKDEPLTNENPKTLKQKIGFLERTIQEIEKERSELSIRATMAEEQVNNFQALMNAASQQYQKKILELNKRVNLVFKYFSWKLLI